ncbi:MAG TPA: tetratricopeptide repeat protein, partial [Burkholderiales bacterium]|nr:tetratricopeptide repeat protein [Burkholderiales bacterium]
SQAEQSLRTLVAERPDDADAHNNLSAVLALRGDLAAAETHLRHAVALAPAQWQMRLNLARLLDRMQRHEAAAESYRSVLALAPDAVAAHVGLGVSLRALGRQSEAIACWERALAIDAGDAQARFHLGNACHHAGHEPGAIAHWQMAVQRDPALSEAWFNLGNSQTAARAYPDAVESYRRALAVRPDWGEALTNLGIALSRCGELDEAIACYRRALERDPDNAYAHLDLGFALLARGDYAGGWPEYEWRWRAGAGIKPRDAELNRPRWRGEPLEGRTLLLHAEQGLGDAIQFIRFAPLVAQRGARVIVECGRPLLRLFAGAPGVAGVCERGRALPQFAAHCPLLSVPLVLGVTLATLPAAAPYLHASPEEQARWRRRLSPGARLRVGLCWAGKQTFKHDAQRSLPFAALAPLAEAAGVHFVSLQVGPAAKQLRQSQDLRVEEFGAELHDLAATAALVANLDLVISADTAVAHLAGALGVRVWLLNRYESEWRWMFGREDSPWYPTLRIFSQRAPGDWIGVIARVAEALRALSGAAAGVR